MLPNWRKVLRIAVSDLSSTDREYICTYIYTHTHTHSHIYIMQYYMNPSILEANFYGNIMKAFIYLLW